jgi:hypothetical protein
MGKLVYNAYKLEIMLFIELEIYDSHSWSMLKLYLFLLKVIINLIYLNVLVNK